MKVRLIYPRWPKLIHQNEFHLPPHGPVVFAATVPEAVELSFCDENVQEVDFEDDAELIAISTMLTCQLPRAFEIADRFRAAGKPVVFGGIATMLHADEVQQHADSVFLGEAEGRFARVLGDFEVGRLQPRYDFQENPPPMEVIGTARRTILERARYNYRGVQMVDLVHASRGCRFKCFPCCSRFLGGTSFRPRPIEKVVAEIEAIPNNRLFIVDNSLSQDRDWLIEFFTALKPLERKWISHPILYDEEILTLAAEAGCWYVYQAIFDTSQVIRDRIRMLKAHDIGIEGTVLLGTDDQDADDVKRLVNFLLEEEVDLAEFTVLTPFPHTPIREQLAGEGRIFSDDWSNYSADKVVFHPKKMSVDELETLYHYAWDTFYASGSYEVRMGELLRKVISREMDDGTHRRYQPRPGRRKWTSPPIP